MEKFRVAILGCGTVGGGLARILLDMQESLSSKSGKRIELARIVDIFPAKSSERFDISRKYFAGNMDELSREDAGAAIKEIINSSDIDLVVETIGGDSDFILNLHLDILRSGKNLVTANKALLAKHNSLIFKTANDNHVSYGFEASVCGAIPIIKTIRDSFSGDQVESFCGIMNGTSNYILTKMQHESLSFDESLKMAQKNGYAELDPTLDISGGDAGNKLIILLKLVYGISVKLEDLKIVGIDKLSGYDFDCAREMDCSIKLICFADKVGDSVFATVRPTMVKNSNILSKINNATNAVALKNLYSREHLLVGEGAGSYETASAIAGDIVSIVKSPDICRIEDSVSKLTFCSADSYITPYIITFDTEDVPGITGVVTTAIGNQNINIDTVGHNSRTVKDRAVFSVATMPCSINQINKAIDEIKQKRPNVFVSEPKIMPIL